MKLLKWLDDHLEEALIAIIICVIALLMMTQIILRTFFKASLSWSDETCRYLFIWAAALGISYSTQRGIHLRMDILPNLVKPLERPLMVLCDIVLTAFALYLLGPGFQVLTQLAQTGQKAAATRIPMYFIYASMWVGLVLSIFRVAERYLKKLYFLISRREKAEE
ncbi:MAG: TRAP transporter small permease [Dysosmobacter sp.]|nr:TRAP transporter small permease [Dysosmobacter sp.]